MVCIDKRVEGGRGGKKIEALLWNRRPPLLQPLLPPSLCCAKRSATLPLAPLPLIPPSPPPPPRLPPLPAPLPQASLLSQLPPRGPFSSRRSRREGGGGLSPFIVGAKSTHPPSTPPPTSPSSHIFRAVAATLRGRSPSPLPPPLRTLLQNQKAVVGRGGGGGGE